MDAAIRPEFSAFAIHPTAEGYLSLAQKIVASPAYQPYDRVIPDLRQLYDQGQYRDLVDTARAHLSGWVLCSALHLYLSLAYHQLGEATASEVERQISVACLTGLLGTGNGREATPYHVTYIEDEPAVLSRLTLKPQRQSLVEPGDGRHYDVYHLEDGTKVWFDISAPKRYLNLRIEGGSSTAPNP